MQILVFHGIYYLNAVYKEIQEELSEEKAKNPKYFIPISGKIPYGSEGPVNCFIVENGRVMVKRYNYTI